MDNTQYPKEQLLFIQAIYDMRQAQIAYFKQPIDHRKRLAMHLEIKVDGLLAPFLKVGAIVPKAKPQDVQKNLFN